MLSFKSCKDRKWSLWTHNTSTPIFIHFFWSMMAKCFMKVEFSRKLYALFSRYSWSNDDMGNPDWDLFALRWAAECAQTKWAFNELESILSQSHETEIKKARFCSNFWKLLWCWVIADLSEERAVSWFSLKSPTLFRAAECFRQSKTWRCLYMLNQSGNTKWGLKRVGVCWENWDLLC
jgi:hypothetical protein